MHTINILRNAFARNIWANLSKHYQHLFTVPNKEILWDMIGKKRDHNPKKNENNPKNGNNPHKKEVTPKKRK